MEKLKTNRVIVVEGKYDAAALTNLVDAVILTTGGFDIYRSRQKQLLLKKLAKQDGLLLLTDSDGAGAQLRNFLKNLAGEKNVRCCYVPALPGKERRKAAPGKEGLLGVEGIPAKTLYECLQKALAEDGPAAAEKTEPDITYQDLYEWGLSGRENSQELKRKLLAALGLPLRLSKKELVEVLNRTVGRKKVEEKLKQL